MFKELAQWLKGSVGRGRFEDRERTGIARSEADYRRVDEINFTYIFANKLANLAVADASIGVTAAGGGESRRAALIGRALGEVFDRAHKITAQALGTGGRVLAPCVRGGKVRVDVVSQDRVFVTQTDGDRAVAATILADVVRQDDRPYYRWTQYALENGAQRMRSLATDAGGRIVPLATVPAWAGLPGEIAISGVDRLTLAFLRCPVDNRQENGLYGVPITYGCEAQISEIREHMRLIEREYRLTRPMLGLNAELWRSPFGEGEPGIEAVRRTVQDGDDPFIPVEGTYDGSNAPWMVYAPDIRNQAMYDRLDRLFELLERAVGTSRGILTARETAAATATEIRAANHDTLTLVSAIRRMWERALDELACAVDVLAEFYGLTPAGARGDFAIAVDWDMSLFESSSETFAQLFQLQQQGMVSKAELRQWARGGTLEDARAAVREIERGAGAAVRKGTAKTN